jgi:hypothetical protein
MFSVSVAARTTERGASLDPELLTSRSSRSIRRFNRGKIRKRLIWCPSARINRRAVLMASSFASPTGMQMSYQTKALPAWKKS